MNKKGMGAGGIALIAILAIIIMGILWIVGSYNGLVSSDTKVEQKWGNVECLGSALINGRCLNPKLVQRTHQRSTSTIR